MDTIQKLIDKELHSDFIAKRQYIHKKFTDRMKIICNKMSKEKSFLGDNNPNFDIPKLILRRNVTQKRDSVDAVLEK